MVTAINPEFFFLKIENLFFSWILTRLKDFEYKRNENLSSRKKARRSVVHNDMKQNKIHTACVCVWTPAPKCILLDSFYCVKGTTLVKSLSLYFCYLWVLPNPFSGLKATGG